MSLSQQGGGKMAKSKKDSVEHTHKDGTKHSHKDGGKTHEHEIIAATVELKGGNKVDVYKKEAKNVYSADYKLIDDTIEKIKKESRRVSTNDYAANNVYLFLQDCLKKVRLAEK